MNSPPSIYIETSVVSYLVARPSRDPIVLGNQMLTQRWWEDCLPGYLALTSDTVIQEAMRGDPDLARQRLKALEPFRVLTVTDDVESLADTYLREGAFPDAARPDALHVAAATIHGVDYIVTWNCRHIAGPSARRKISLINRRLSLYEPEIVTPGALYDAT